MYICSGEECREGSNSEDAYGYRYGSSESGDGGDREADAGTDAVTFAESESFGKSDSESESNAEWKSDAGA